MKNSRRTEIVKKEVDSEIENVYRRVALRQGSQIQKHHNV